MGKIADSECLSDTVYSPTDYAQAWEQVGGKDGGDDDEAEETTE